MVWLRHFDLRLHDHPALFHAAQRRRPVHVVFAWAEEEDALQGEWQLAGTAFAFWLHHALASFDASLRSRYGLAVTVRTGKSMADVLSNAAAEAGVDEVVTSSSTEAWARRSESTAKAALEAAGLRFRSFNSFLLQDISEVKVDMGTYRGHFGTLTPFHHAHMSCPPVPRPAPAPPSLTAPCKALGSEGLAALGFARMPLRKDGSVLDWGKQILESWDISEEAGLSTLRAFLAPGGGLQRYEKGRQLADASAVTRISPYLRSGMLSCRLMFHEMRAASAKEQSIVYWRRLIWRDLAYWQLMLFPKMQTEPIRAHYAGQTWNQDPAALERWQRGMTGYPIVDAGMRELWTTGWMAQNVRMVAAIMLCEHLNINWVEGERWFHHTLVDADLAINAMMWQNAGKGGLDQWNFTMDAGSSGKNQDPTGNYVRRWCPELARLPLKFLHKPWDAPEDVLRDAGVKLGANYPARIVVNLKAASKVSGDAIRQQRKRTAEDWSNNQGYDLILLPRGSTVAHDGQKFRVFTKPEFRNAAESSGDGGWNHGGRGVQRGWDAAGEEPDYSTRPASTRGKGRGKGRSRGQATDHGHKQSAQSSHQTVLDEYMRASGG